MSVPSQLDLEGKTEQAFIAWLKTSPALSARIIVPSADESPKQNGTITVKAKRGTESSEGTGVWFVDVEIELQLRIKKGAGSDSLSDFRSVRASIAERLEIQWRIMSRNLSSVASNFHCYYYKIMSSAHDPSDGQHHSLFTLQIEAMPITFAQALLTQNPPGRNTFSFLRNP